MVKARFIPEHYGGIPDVWKLESTISQNKDLWWGESLCQAEGCMVPACQLDERGYRCEDHR